jgi:hypothetical protein
MTSSFTGGRSKNKTRVPVGATYFNLERLTDLGPLPVLEEMDEGLIQKFMKRRKGRSQTYGEKDYALSPSSLSKKMLLGS